MSDAHTFYFADGLRKELSQGDIFDGVPLVHVKSDPVCLKPVTLSKNRNGFESETWDPGNRVDRQIAAHADLTRAVLLNHDCEIDKPETKHLLVALIRLLPETKPEKDKATIRANQRLAYFHLPGINSLAEGYVDFRRISVVSAFLIGTATKIASMADDARLTMCEQLFRFLTRTEFNPGANVELPQAE